MLVSESTPLASSLCGSRQKKLENLKIVEMSLIVADHVYCQDVLSP